MTLAFSTRVSPIDRVVAAAALQVLLAAVSAFPAVAQNQATQPYLLTVDACMPSACSTGPSGAMVYLLQSADGVTWSRVPGFTPFEGSVAGSARRGNIIYIVTQAPPSQSLPQQLWASAMQTVKYHTDTGVQDAPVLFVIQDAQYPAGTYTLQDPSLSLNPQGQLVITYDVANVPGPDCPGDNCHIRMAIEGAGSDGTAYTAQTNDAVTYSTTALLDPSKPYFDGTQWIIFAGNSPAPPNSPAELVFTASSFAGPYSLYSGLPNGELSSSSLLHQVSGFFSAAQSMYWDYFSTGQNISYVGLPSLTQQITSAEVSNPDNVVSNTTLGLSGETLQHPHFASNCCHADAASHDFNGDGTSDILWRDTSGDLAMWLMSGGQLSSGATITQVQGSWSVVGQRDFNGDGDGDLLWLDTSGDLGLWEMNGTSVGAQIGLGNVGASWSVVGTGDFNGDGTGDILWRDGSGDLAIWLMSNGRFSSGVSLGQVASAWSVAGTGDFNGDGTTDILWYNTQTGDVAIWLMSNGQVSSGVSLGNVGTSWSVAGTGDFNGDGTSDILWRDTSGDYAIWLISNGQFSSGATIASGVANTWQVAETGDFNGDGKSDILWSDTSGDLGVWLMNGTNVSSANGLGNVGTTWTVQGQNAD